MPGDLNDQKYSKAYFPCLKSLAKLYGKHIVYSDGGTWYPEACNSLGLTHILHSPFEKSIIERTMESVKDRTECFDDYFPCRKKNCKLLHVWNWLNLFVGYHNKQLQIVK